MVLNRLARCYIKSGNISQGLRTYKTILENFSNELSAEGIYLGIIAAYQICRITQKNEPGNTGPALLEFFDSLVKDFWPLDKGAFLYYWNLIKKMSDDLSQNKDDWEGGRNFWTRWQQNERQAENKLKKLTADEDFITRIIPIVQTRMFEFVDRTQKFVRFAEKIDKNLYLVCASIVQEKTLLGISINKKTLLQTRIHEILEDLPIPDDWIIQLTSSTGDIISGEENADQEKAAQGPSFEADFNDQFPPWKIRIYMRDPLRIQRQLNVRRNIYILIVVLVTAVLFFGGYMVIRSTSKELELAKLKSEFVATVSHEFRTPLMSIRYLSEMLDTGRVREEEKKKLYYGKIHKESERLRRLIENMLDFSKIEAGMKKYNFDNLSVHDMMEEITGRFHEYVSDNKVILQGEIPDRLPEIFADKDAISTALFNLLDNAFKYSGKNPVIYLRAGVEDYNIFFEVEDKGPGIGKEEQKKVFGKFYRTSDPAKTNIEGSGIGLTLVDHIAKAHGGNVRMESTPGQGTRVRIQIPISQKGKNDG
jgi:signal transduction histidine kinase